MRPCCNRSKHALSTKQELTPMHDGLKRGHAIFRRRSWAGQWARCPGHWPPHSRPLAAGACTWKSRPAGPSSNGYANGLAHNGFTSASHVAIRALFVSGNKMLDMPKSASRRPAVAAESAAYWSNAAQVAQMYLQFASLSYLLVCCAALAWIGSPAADAWKARKDSKAAEKERLLRSQARPCPHMMPVPASLPSMRKHKCSTTDCKT